MSPSSPGHLQDFFASLFFINSPLSNTHPFSNIGFLLLVLGLEWCAAFLGEKRWIYWYIGNIGFTWPGSTLAACGFCILMVWRDARREKVWVNFWRGFSRIEIETFLGARGFWLVPGFKILSKWQANPKRIFGVTLYFIINLRRVQDLRGDSLFSNLHFLHLL